MPKSYFELPEAGQREVIEEAFIQTGRSPNVIEKDIWLTLVLKLLFGMPGRKSMAFKGGTSLSKVHGVIKRFSEDVDITVDFRELGCQYSVPQLRELSGNKRKQESEALINAVSIYIRDTLCPYLNNELKNYGCASECVVSLSDDGESILVHYPTRASDTQGYLRDHVLVEFGGRNIIDPNEAHCIQPDIAELFEGIVFPRAENVVVLSPARTFWEKVTLIHAQCNKTIPAGKERVSRHWYDLAMLLQHQVGQTAKNDLELLKDVVALKSVFYNSATAYYDRCVSGELNLIPDQENLRLLSADYDAMGRSGMLNGHVYSMENIMADLQAFQTHVNELTRTV